METKRQITDVDVPFFALLAWMFRWVLAALVVGLVTVLAIAIAFKLGLDPEFVKRFR